MHKMMIDAITMKITDTILARRRDLLQRSGDRTPFFDGIFDQARKAGEMIEQLEDRPYYFEKDHMALEGRMVAAEESIRRNTQAFAETNDPHYANESLTAESNLEFVHGQDLVYFAVSAFFNDFGRYKPDPMLAALLDITSSPDYKPVPHALVREHRNFRGGWEKMSQVGFPSEDVAILSLSDADLPRGQYAPAGMSFPLRVDFQPNRETGKLHWSLISEECETLARGCADDLVEMREQIVEAYRDEGISPSEAIAGAFMITQNMCLTHVEWSGRQLKSLPMGMKINNSDALEDVLPNVAFHAEVIDRLRIKRAIRESLEADGIFIKMDAVIAEHLESKLAELYPDTAPRPDQDNSPSM